MPAFDTAQLPARRQSVALERKHLYGVDRQVVADVIAAVTLGGRTVVGLFQFESSDWTQAVRFRQTAPETVVTQQCDTEPSRVTVYPIRVHAKTLRQAVHEILRLQSTPLLTLTARREYNSSQL